MFSRIVSLATAASVCLALSVSLWAAQPGSTETVFNKRFLPNIKPAMGYDRMVQIVGIRGALVDEKKAGGVAVSRYRWKGGKHSTLTVTVVDRKIVESTMLAPNGHTYQIGRNGAIKDLGD